MPRYQYEQPPQQIIDARAPMAQPKEGLTGGSGLTDPLVWANKFRRNDSQLTSLPAAPSITDHVLNAINTPSPWTPPGQPFASGNQAQPPSLTQLAQTGVNHLQQWTQKSGQYGQIQTNPDMSRTLTSPYGSGRTIFGGSMETQPDMLSGNDPRKKPFGFMSAFR